MKKLIPALVLSLLLSACASVPTEMFRVVPTPDPNLPFKTYQQSPNGYFRMMTEGKETLSLLSQDQMVNDVWLRVWAKSAIRQDRAREVVETLPSSVSEGFLMAVYMEFFLQLRHACNESGEEIAGMISESVEEVSNVGYVDLPVLATTQSLGLYFRYLSEKRGQMLTCWDYTDAFNYESNMFIWCFAENECVNQP